MKTETRTAYQWAEWLEDQSRAEPYVAEALDSIHRETKLPMAIHNLMQVSSCVRQSFDVWQSTWDTGAHFQFHLTSPCGLVLQSRRAFKILEKAVKSEGVGPGADMKEVRGLLPFIVEREQDIFSKLGYSLENFPQELLQKFSGNQEQATLAFAIINIAAQMSLIGQELRAVVTNPDMLEVSTGRIFRGTPLTVELLEPQDPLPQQTM